MSLAWSSVKALSIPVGGVSRDVKRVAVGGVEVWRKLPYDAEVEYIESTGTQWIDTGIREVDGTFSSDITVMLTDRTQGDILSAWGTKSRFYPLAYISANTLYACSFQGSWTTTNTAKIANISLNTKYRALSELSAQGVSIEINGQSNHVSRYDGYPTGSELAIFKRGGPGQTTYVKCKLYSLSIRINQILAHDFIPVRVGSEGCLYDQITDKLFHNAGTGAFVVGPDKGTSLSMSPFLYLEETDLNPSDADATGSETQEEPQEETPQTD